MSLDRSALAEAVAAHGRVARVVVIAADGSTPRGAGTSMLVWDQGGSGGQSGTIGGGALEWEAAKAARALLARDGIFLRQELKLPLGPALGQCCGGHATLLIEVIGPDELAAIPEDQPFARPVTSGGATELPLAVSRILAAVRSGRDPALPARADGWLVEAVGTTARPLFLYGAGHVGRAVVQVLDGLPFAVTWIDDDRARFPDPVTGAAMLVAANPADAVALAPADAIHLVMTYSHALDLEVCHRVLSRSFGVLGLIGSATKRARFAKRLAELGHPAASIERLICPIGDRQLGKEPKAIAIGLAHSLLSGQFRAGAASGGRVGASA